MKKIIFLLVAHVFFNTGINGQTKIFNSKSLYKYKVEYSNDSLNVHTSEQIDIISTGNNWVRSPKNQKEIIIKYNYSKQDSIVCENLPTIGWLKYDTTGAVDNNNTCWFHPPRNNQYRINETAPFPRVEFPLELHKVYKRFLFIGDGLGDLSNSKYTWQYEVVGKITIDSIEYWHISSISYPEKNTNIVNKLDFYFNERKGFYQLNYTFYDKTKIEMKLIESCNEKQ